jgi:SAM-dependent methyltransferase
VNTQFDPGEFWNARLTREPTLRGTGHRSFSLAYNDLLYAAQAEALADLLARWQVEVRGKSVLDVGSGVGFYVSFFQSAGAATLVGLDIAAASVDYLREHFPACQFRVADIGSADVPLDRQYDIVSIVSVLYHLVDDRRFERALTNLAQLTAPGGYLILNDCFARTPVTPRHVRFRNHDRYAAILQQHGLDILETAPIYYLMNRTFIPKLGPWLLGQPRIARALFNYDRQQRQAGRPNGSGMKLMLACRKDEH